MKNVVQTRYPKADIKGFLGRAAWISGCLVVIHWSPDIMVWVYANLLDKTIVINERRFNALLVIAYIMAGFGTLFELSGMLYATYQNRKLDREERQRQRSAIEKQAGNS